MNKADRGELILHPPFGYVYNADKTSYELDPDEQAQSVVRLLFAEFERQGTIYSLLRYLAKNDIRLPIRPTYGPNRGQLEWRRPNRTTLNTMLQHPTYAGAYRYGYRYHDPRKRVAGKKGTGIVRIPMDECRVLIKDRFPAYISWEQFERNRQRLSQNQSRAKTQGAPRRGPSLLGDRCERQFQAVEPENRLVARTLEKSWEAALREQEKLTVEYEDFSRTRSATLTDQQRTLIRNLSEDVPKLWNAPTTTPEDRQQIMRMLIDRIELNVEGHSEQAEITVTWAGGFISRHQYEKTVISYSQLSYLDELIARMTELKETCADLGEVAVQLSKEGYQPLRRETFTGAMVSRLLVKHGIHSPLKRLPPDGVLQENECWIGELAKRLGMPRTTLDHWRKSGWIHARKLPGLRGRWIVWADKAEVTRLEQLRAARRRWSDCPFPPELTTPTSNPPNASTS